MLLMPLAYIAVDTIVSAISSFTEHPGVTIRAGYALYTLTKEGRYLALAEDMLGFSNPYAVAALNALTFESRAGSACKKMPVTIEQLQTLQQIDQPSQAEAYKMLLHMVDRDYCGDVMLDREAISHLEDLALCFDTQEKTDKLHDAIEEVRGYYTVDTIENICHDLMIDPVFGPCHPS